MSRLFSMALLAALIVTQGGCRQEIPAASAAGETVQALSFVDVTGQAGLATFAHRTGAFGAKWFPETMGSGGGFLDYDGDGWEDLLLVGGGAWEERGEDVQALWLFRNNGDGTFADVTEQAGLAGVRAYGFGVTAADYDNDGDQDFFLTTLHRNLLFRNEPHPSGEGRIFAEVGTPAGVSDRAAWSTAALFFDSDRDGWLDLFVGNYVRWSPERDIPCTVDGTERVYCQPTLYEGEPPHFYRNNGDGTFSEHAQEAGFAASPGKTLGVAELDVNGDGWSDLAVANDLMPDQLYINRGDGSFEERGAPSGMAFSSEGKARGGMGIDVGVADTTGQPSIFVGNFAQEMTGVYRYQGNGTFQDRAAVSRIGRVSLPVVTFGLFLFDADLDGDLDLFAANGHIRENVARQRDGSTYEQPPHLYLNEGDGTFVLAAAGGENALATPVVGRGAAYADYDRDGDLDVLVTENGRGARLWRNESDGKASVRVRLEGRPGGAPHASSRDALGARVVAYRGGERLERRVRTGSSYLSQSERTVTFGLGSAPMLDSLVVHWPSGRTDRLGAVERGRELQIVEGPGQSAQR